MRLTFLVIMVMLMVLVMVSAQEGENPEARRSRFAHPPEALSKPEDLREEHEWPQDIVDTGKRTQLGSYGYVKQLRINCVEKGIQGACDVLNNNNIPQVKAEL